MIDLKRSKKERTDEAKGMAIGFSVYPYWSDFTLDKEDVAKIPALKNADAGDEVTLIAKCSISRVEIVDEEDGKKVKNQRRVTIQMKQIDVRDNSEEELDEVFAAEADKE